MASVSYAADESLPETSGRSARRTALAYSGRVARWNSSWWRITITPRPSSAARSSTSACSTAVRSLSVACCSSRSLSGRLELNRIASTAADTSLSPLGTGRLPRFDVDGTESFLLRDSHEGPPQQLEHRDEGDHRLEPVL